VSGCHHRETFWFPSNLTDDEWRLFDADSVRTGGGKRTVIMRDVFAKALAEVLPPLDVEIVEVPTYRNELGCGHDSLE
jgi:hypothetical protein